MNQLKTLAEAVKQAAAECGYIDCGIASAEPFALYSRALRRRIMRFPETTELYQPMTERTDPPHGAPWVQAVVVCVRRYGLYRLPPGTGDHIGRNYLADRRVKASPDHPMPTRMTAALRKLGLRVKRGGLPDRLAGARAGVVKIGRNGFAYHRRAGSWINIECWRVDAPLPPDPPTLDCPCPPQCRACLEACPTQALCKPYLMRMDRCVAYLAYSAPWPIPKQLWRCMGKWIYGCDDCQLACPLNRGKWRDLKPMPWLEPIAHLLTPEALATMDHETYRKHIFPYFWYIPENNPERWRANAARARRSRNETRQ